GNSDADDIFPVAGYRRLTEKTRKIYELYCAGEKFALLETKGPHKDTPELRAGAFKWMNRWIKNDTNDIQDPDRPRFTPQQLKVLAKPPADANNAIVHESFIKPARTELPESPEVARQWWAGKRKEWLDALRSRVFGGWPSKPVDLASKPAADIKHQGLR